MILTTDALLEEVLRKIHGAILTNRSVTTSSIYCRMPDGYGLRIGDHKGREKYSYKYNIDPCWQGLGKWVDEYNRIDARSYWRYYTASVDELATVCAQQIERGFIKRPRPAREASV